MIREEDGDQETWEMISFFPGARGGSLSQAVGVRAMAREIQEEVDITRHGGSWAHGKKEPRGFTESREH